MDKKGKDKKKDFAKEAVQNDKVRIMTFHKMTVEQLEEAFNTRIKGEGENDEGKYFGLTHDQAA